jgi:hypothetical protein
MKQQRFSQSDILEAEHDANVRGRRIMLGLKTGVIIDGSQKGSPILSKGISVSLEGTLFTVSPFRPLFRGDFHILLDSVQWMSVPETGETWQSYTRSEMEIQKSANRHSDGPVLADELIAKWNGV